MGGAHGADEALVSSITNADELCPVPVALLTGSVGPRHPRQRARRALAERQHPHRGRHACVQEAAEDRDLALAVIDEQPGLASISGSCSAPRVSDDVLAMTVTPDPAHARLMQWG